MVKKKSSLWLSLLCAIAWQAWAAPTVVSLESFDQIELNGAMQVQIQVGQAKSALQIDAPTSQLENIRLDSKNKVLSIRQNNVVYKRAKPQITIYTPSLTALTVKGNNDVQIQQLNSRQLSVLADNQGDIAITGVIGLEQLTARGNGFISVYWVNAPKARIFAQGDMRILLRGKVTSLYADVLQTSSLNARYLAADYGYIKAAGHARVDIAVSQILNAQATGQSNIYYYQKPAYLSQDMHDNGAVLNVVGEPLVK